MLRIIKRQGDCTLDDLVDEGGSSISELQHTLLLLELAGRIRCSSGWIHPA